MSIGGHFGLDHGGFRTCSGCYGHTPKNSKYEINLLKNKDLKSYPRKKWPPDGHVGFLNMTFFNSFRVLWSYRISVQDIEMI